eukprot:TRINITY_DN7505_c0_g1_i1.p1 TRINITY_DN7505_c0_g1~~TRINITY_DN7505_c0_g1_i1.p1  ORF type:complete len:547 (+),score=129.66 TRINITY_DN7505_c0_g1_i1:78-1643(+)
MRGPALALLAAAASAAAPPTREGAERPAHAVGGRRSSPAVHEAPARHAHPAPHRTGPAEGSRRRAQDAGAKGRREGGDKGRAAHSASEHGHRREGGDKGRAAHSASEHGHRREGGDKGRAAHSASEHGHRREREGGGERRRHSEAAAAPRGAKGGRGSTAPGGGAGRGEGRCAQLREALRSSRRKYPHGAAVIIGANIGLGQPGNASISLADLADPALFGPAYTKLLVEPIEPIYKELRNRVLQQLQLKNASLLNTAVGSEDGSTTLWCLAAAREHPGSVGQICSTHREHVVAGIPHIATELTSLVRSGLLPQATMARILALAKEASPAAPAPQGATPPAPPLSVGVGGARKLLRYIPASRLSKHGKLPQHLRKHKTHHEVDAGGHSTVRKKVVHTPTLVHVRSPVVTPRRLLQQADVELRHVRFVQIDTQGNELEILRGLPFAPPPAGQAAGRGSPFRPSVVLWTQRLLSPEQRSKARILMAQQGYRVCPTPGCAQQKSPGRPTGHALDGCGSVFAVRTR